MKLTTENDTEFIKLSYEEFLREDFINRALVVWLDHDHLIQKIFYNSSSYGTVYWNTETGLHNCHSWETEDQAMEGSFIQRMYPAITHNGMESIDYAGRVVDDVMEGLRLTRPELYESLQNLQIGQYFQWPDKIQS